MYRFLIVLIFILSHRSTAVEVIPTDTIFAELSSGKYESLQGQTPLCTPANSFPFERVYGLEETISYSWESEDSSWRPSMRSVFSYTENDDVSEVKRYLWNADATTWDIKDNSIFTYHAPGKIDDDTYYSYNNGAWVEGLQKRYTYDEADFLVSSVSFQWDTIAGDWDTVPYISVSYSHDANGRFDTISENTLQRQDIIYTYTYQPDGRLDLELLYYVQYGRYTRTFHYYPDLLTENIIFQDTKTDSGWETRDSLILTYNKAGMPESYLLLRQDYNVWTTRKSEVTTYDGNSRPTMKLTDSYLGSDYGAGVILKLSRKKTVYHYDSLNAVLNTQRVLKNEKTLFCRILNSNLVLVNGLLPGRHQTRATLYSVNGGMIYTGMVPVDNGTARLQLKTPLPAGYYLVVIGEQGLRYIVGVFSGG